MRVFQCYHPIADRYRHFANQDQADRCADDWNHVSGPYGEKRLDEIEIEGKPIPLCKPIEINITKTTDVCRELDALGHPGRERLGSFEPNFIRELADLSVFCARLYKEYSAKAVIAKAPSVKYSSSGRALAALDIGKYIEGLK